MVYFLVITALVIGVGHSVDDYQCTGHLEADFLEVTALLGMSEIPTVTPRPSGALSPAIRKGIRGEIEVVSKMATGVAQC